MLIKKKQQNDFSEWDLPEIDISLQDETKSTELSLLAAAWSANLFDFKVSFCFQEPLTFHPRFEKPLRKILHLQFKKMICCRPKSPN